MRLADFAGATSLALSESLAILVGLVGSAGLKSLAGFAVSWYVEELSNCKCVVSVLFSSGIRQLFTQNWRQFQKRETTPITREVSQLLARSIAQVTKRTGVFVAWRVLIAESNITNRCSKTK